ncbi:TetR/AcrR family transcriptional regulator [Ottowia thiooxydans]|uniref:TetR/AcrR family transcriptional regulator n=1 Tax=Ottowia thiooxydans TaxID=219182 RepID=UPI0006885158|nr:TetR/AcrR family transcriptional regulator [Ottowia thiooxydans]
MSSNSPVARRKPPADAAPVARVLPKGQQTKAAIVDAALRMATQVGLEGLSIGTLAEAIGMSKSGVFAHFGSREELQISVVNEYYARFERDVFYPALQEPRGLPRLRAMFANWMRHTGAELDSGCIFISGAVEFDDRPGPVHDALAQSVGSWLDAMTRAVRQSREENHLSSEIDERQVTFEVHALILALHYEARFLHLPGAVERATRGFESILSRYSVSN